MMIIYIYWTWWFVNQVFPSCNYYTDYTNPAKHKTLPASSTAEPENATHQGYVQTCVITNLGRQRGVKHSYWDVHGT